MKTKDEMMAMYVGDRLLAKEVVNIDYIPRDDGWQFEIVLNDYSVIALSQEEFDTLFRQGKVSPELFGKTLLGRLSAKFGHSAQIMEDNNRVRVAMLVLFAAKDDEVLFARLLGTLTGGKIII